MKKKGLIISTVVMVVVLIASLTTATYAWFSNNANATVENIQLSAKAASPLLVGVATGGQAGKPAQLDGGAVVSGDITKDTTNWTGTVQHLGSTVTFPEDAKLDLSSAVSINKEAEQINSAIDQWGWYKGNSEGNSSDLNDKTAKAAVQNTDYFYANFIVVPEAANNVKQAWAKIIVAPTDSTQLGMAGAITFAFKINGQIVKISTGAADVSLQHVGEDDSTINAFTGQPYGNPVGTGDSITAGVYDQESNTWTYYVNILAFNNSYHANTIDGAVSFEVYAWIEGSSPYCNNSTTGTGASISIEFEASTGAEAQEKEIKSGKEPTNKVA